MVMPISVYQTKCRECYAKIWHKINEDNHLVCPECGARLNQQSSEDASEGNFTTEKAEEEMIRERDNVC